MMPVTCAQTALLGPGLIVAAFAIAGPRADPGSLQETVTCYLQGRHPGPHYGITLELAQTDGSAVWAVWLTPDAPQLAIIPPCPAVDTTGDACTEPQGHAGGHTWQIRDPLMEVARAQLARIPLTGP